MSDTDIKSEPAKVVDLPARPSASHARLLPKGRIRNSAPDRPRHRRRRRGARLGGMELLHARTPWTCDGTRPYVVTMARSPAACRAAGARQSARAQGRCARSSADQLQDCRPLAEAAVHQAQANAGPSMRRSRGSRSRRQPGAGGTGAGGGDVLTARHGTEDLAERRPGPCKWSKRPRT
jgi:hypothetical protein